LQDKLSREQGVNTEIHIQDHSAGFSGGLDQRSRDQQQPPSQSQSAARSGFFGDSSDEAVRTTSATVAAAMASADARLDIRV
jgi:hypothetical protein